MVIDNKMRVALSEQIKESPRRDVASLSELVGFAIASGMENESGRLLSLAVRVEQCEGNITRCALPNPNVEVKVPVAGRLERMNNSDQDQRRS